MGLNWSGGASGLGKAMMMIGGDMAQENRQKKWNDEIAKRQQAQLDQRNRELYQRKLDDEEAFNRQRRFFEEKMAAQAAEYDRRNPLLPGGIPGMSLGFDGPAGGGLRYNDAVDWMQREAMQQDMLERIEAQADASLSAAMKKRNAVGPTQAEVSATTRELRELLGDDELLYRNLAPGLASAAAESLNAGYDPPGAAHAAREGTGIPGLLASGIVERTGSGGLRDPQGGLQIPFTGIGVPVLDTFFDKLNRDFQVDEVIPVAGGMITAVRGHEGDHRNKIKIYDPQAPDKLIDVFDVGGNAVAMQRNIGDRLMWVRLDLKTGDLGRLSPEEQKLAGISQEY